jgi:Uma2 family endonuclease
MVQQATRPTIVRGQWYPLSWDEFLAWSPEGKTEWVDGEGIAYVSTSARHAKMVLFWTKLLSNFVDVFNLGEVFIDEFLMRLPSRRSGREPDVLVVLTEHQDRVWERWLEGPADFVTEFLSEDDPDRDTVVKLREYECEGVPEYLWVDARSDHRDFRFHRRGDDGTYRLVAPDAEGRYHSEVLPGIWFDPAWFWHDPLPNVDRLMLQISPEAYRRYLAQLLVESAEE